MLLVAALALLIATAMDTRAKGLGVWRSSSLAAVLHGLSDTGRVATGTSNDAKGMEREARDVDVKVDVAADGRVLLRVMPGR